MPRKKKNTAKKVVSKKLPEKTTRKVKAKESNPLNYLDQLKLDESYISLILGALVVLVVAIFLFVFFKGNKSFRAGFNNTSVLPTNAVKMQKTNVKTYVVQEGEGLSDIAQRFYGNPDYWTNIAQANNLSDPNALEPGMKIIIPTIKK